MLSHTKLAVTPSALDHSKILKENPRVGVYIGPWVLNLARLQEDGGHQNVQLGHQLEQFSSWEVLECELSKYSGTIVIV